MKEFHGCYPTMITPFTEDGRVDFNAVEGLVEWYIAHGADGIFAVCQSSEMFFLSDEEKINIAKTVAERADGRVKVVASGHTDDSIEKQIDMLGRISETGVDAVVIVSNRLAGKDEGDDEMRRNAERIFSALPDVVFGLYECPYPYLKLLSDGFLCDHAHTGKLRFIKDVSCSEQVQKRRVALTEGTACSLFNANTSTLLSSLQAGYDGYNGVMANYHIDLYSWLYRNWMADERTSEELSDFLTIAAVLEARAYPVSAKWYQNAYGVPMSITTRSKDPALLNENAIHEIESLKRMEDAWRRRLFAE